MSRIVECWRCDGLGFTLLGYDCHNCSGSGSVVEEDKEPDDNLDDYVEDEDGRS